MRWRHFVAANYRPSLVGILLLLSCHRNTCLEPKWWFMRCHRVVLKIMFLESLIIESKKNCKLTVWWLNHHAINIIVSGRVWVGGKKKKRNKKVEAGCQNNRKKWFLWYFHENLFFFFFFLNFHCTNHFSLTTFLFSFFLSLTFTLSLFCPFFVTCWLIKPF